MFEGKKVRLRSLELTDLDNLSKYDNDLEVRITTGKAIPRSRGEYEDFIRSSWKLRQEGKGGIFAVETLTSKRFLGYCALIVKNRIARSYDLGIFIIDKTQWDKGYGTDTMRVMLDIGFNYLNCHRIELGVYPINERGIHVYKKIGFKEVGRLRESRFMNGNYRDMIIMDILEKEWKSE